MNTVTNIFWLKIRELSMKSKKLLKTSLLGTGILIVCCFTPALVILLGAVGLSAWLAWLDYVLLPLLVLFIGLTIFALLRLRKTSVDQN